MWKPQTATKRNNFSSHGGGGVTITEFFAQKYHCNLCARLSDIYFHFRLRSRAKARSTGSLVKVKDDDDDNDDEKAAKRSWFAVSEQALRRRLGFLGVDRLDWRALSHSAGLSRVSGRSRTGFRLRETQAASKNSHFTFFSPRIKPRFIDQEK